MQLKRYEYGKKYLPEQGLFMNVAAGVEKMMARW
jgi:hypothetical protein